MPLYEYQCLSCGRRTEFLQSFSGPPLDKCPECGGAVKKLMSAPAVQFKGTGWYVTDYAGKKSSSESKSESKSDEKSGDSSSIVTSNESKSGSSGAEKSSTSDSGTKSAPADSPKN
jgi:putative FmdB family regulatory protein